MESMQREKMYMFPFSVAHKTNQAKPLPREHAEKRRAESALVIPDKRIINIHKQVKMRDLGLKRGFGFNIGKNNLFIPEKQGINNKYRIQNTGNNQQIVDNALKAFGRKITPENGVSEPQRHYEEISLRYPIGREPVKRHISE